MKIKQLLIAGGNSTLLVWDCKPLEKQKIIEKYLGKVEQIGFVKTKKKLPVLEMMGGELCINATIALASQLDKKGFLYTSGVKEKVAYENRDSKTSITITLNYRKEKNIVLLEGIGYINLKDEAKITKGVLTTLAKKYNLPAFGAILYKDKTLIPYVYVKGTNSLFKETACGSGSIAASLVLNIKSIRQPTGKEIIVKRNNKTFTVTAEVDTIGDNYE